MTTILTDSLPRTIDEFPSKGERDVRAKRWRTCWNDSAAFQPIAGASPTGTGDGDRNRFAEACLPHTSEDLRTDRWRHW